MIKIPQVRQEMIRLGGGWDQLTPILNLKPGAVRDALNFEASVTGGYTRISGYERFDGRPSPSEASYVRVFFSAFMYTPAVGDTLTGATSAATGICIATGTDGTSDFAVLSKVSGNFAIGESVSVGVDVVGTTTPSTSGLVPELHATYLGLAANLYRADIQQIPGSGPALGYVLYRDVVYGFRADAGGTSVGIYKSSATGWVNVPLFNEVYFTAGTNTPSEGDTLTQGGVTATIKRVVLQSGAWTGTAAGKLIVDTPSGGNFASGSATAGGSTTITLSGAETAISMNTAAGQKFEFCTANFYGGAGTDRVYGCDGVNRMFEFDGTILVPIDTGFTPDSPKHIQAHKGYLMATFGASLGYSAPGLPYDWTALSGAGEIGAGETLTGIKTLPGSQGTATLLVTSRNNTFMLYGVSPSDFNFVSYNSGAGALDYTIQNMADTFLFDDRGVITLQASLTFGNFEQATLTYQINRFIEQQRTNVSYSTLNRRKSQYRVFFSSGYGLYVTVANRNFIGAMPVFYPNPVYMCDESKFSDGSEASFFCSTDGYVYQLDKGTSFDGLPMNEYLNLTYSFSNTPRNRKRYRKAAVELSGDGYSNFQFGYALGYQNPDIGTPANVTYESVRQSLLWDAFTWDAFVWDGRTVIPSECEMTGTAENVSITIRSATPYYKPYTINSIILHYTLQRSMR